MTLDTEPHTHDLRISRHLTAPRDRIWRAWTDPALLVRWWCPAPWTTELKAFDLRPGGGFHTVMRGPDGGLSDNPGCVLAIEPGHRIVFTNQLGAGYRPIVPWLSMTAVFTLDDEDGGTRYTACAMHPDAATCARHAELGFDAGWNVCIDQLDALARTLT